MPFSESLRVAVNDYCKNHFADEDWYNEKFEFIEEESFRKRIIVEFSGTRFAYKLYEGIAATDENLIFEVRHQILAYASIYEAVIHYITIRILRNSIACSIILFQQRCHFLKNK